MAVQQAMAVRAMSSAQPPVLKKSDFFPLMVEVLESRAKKSDFLKSDSFSVYDVPKVRHGKLKVEKQLHVRKVNRKIYGETAESSRACIFTASTSLDSREKFG